MSRSIHTTRSEVDDLATADFASDEQREAVLSQAERSLRHKRRVKASARGTRRRTGRRGASHLDTIPIVITGLRAHAHHVATRDDVRAVLARLPAGSTDGLARVTLGMGIQYNADAHRRDPKGAERDTLIGRFGYEGFPGVYTGAILGIYTSGTASIHVFAHAYRDDEPLREIWEILLKACTLSTLVHEVGHHHDHTDRIARGRWIARGTHRVERYAEEREQAGVETAVLPYLRETYAADVERLEAWVAHHGGIRLPLATLLGDSRVRLRKGLVNPTEFAFSMRAGLEALMRAVREGDPLIETRLRFARWMHYRDMYAESLRILDIVLADHPHHTEALVQRADSLSRNGTPGEAIEIARRIVANHPLHERAWVVLMQAFEELRQWTDVIATATPLLAIAAADQDRRLSERMLMRRAAARIELGDAAGAQSDLDSVDATTLLSTGRRWLQRLRERLAGISDDAAG